MNERKKHGWPFWFAFAAIALPLLYVGSFGPACWITSRHRQLERWVWAIYWPLGYAAAFANRESFPVWNALLRYGGCLEDQESIGTIGGVSLGVLVYAIEREGDWSIGR